MIDEKVVQLLLQVERSVAVLSGYVHGVLMQKQQSEPVILVSEKEVIENEKTQLFVAEDTNKLDKSVVSVSFDFTKKELKKMKENFAKHYTQNGLVLNVRAKGNVYEIRYRRDGLNLSASSKVLEDAKNKMKALLKTAYTETKEEPVVEAQKTAMQYIEWYIDEVKRPNHNERYVAYLKGYAKNHLLPVFSDRVFSDIPFSDLQRLMSDLTRAGKNRTAKGIRTLLKEVYRSAVYDGLVRINHADRLAPIIYQEEHGEALTLEKEREAVQAILRSESSHKNDFLILLFLGLRPCELRSLKYDGDFAEVICAKKRTGLVITRKIPLSPMFRRYVDLNEPISHVETRQLEKSFSVIFGDRISLYDFRHTFITRAQECGVPENVVQAWVGHSQKTLTGKTYTHFSDEYMIEQSKKIDY
jgi:integrase